MSANAPCTRRWRRQRTRRGHLVRSVPDRSCAIATRGVVSADAKRPARRRGGVSSAQRRAATRSLHANATWAMAVTTGAPSSESAAGAFTATWVSHRSTAAPRRSAATSPFPSVQNHSPLTPIHRRHVRALVRPCMSACGAAYRQTSARMRSTAASDVAIYDPLSQSATPCVANLRVVADGLSPSKAQS